MSASQLPTARLNTASGAPSEPTAATRGSRSRGEAPLVLGRYRLHRRLGAGGFGTVWSARDERLDRDVAVKIVPRERIVGGRLEREARAAARLSHPGIVTLYEAAVDDEGAYLVSELVHGATLDALLGDGRLSDRDIIEIAIGLCDALSHAHAQGIVHRDVKPSNVLIPDHPSSPAQPAKLTDFGVARVIGGDSLTRTGDVIGTAAYMAPEQAEGLEAGAPADLYALALVIYEALTGVNPVRTGAAAQRARRLGAYLPPLRRQRRDLPRELGRSIDLALRPRPRERGTLGELRAALTQTLPLMHDAPGIVTSSWPTRTEPVAGSHPAPELSEPFAHQPTAAEEPEAPTSSRPWPQRALAALAAGSLAGWLSIHLYSHPPIAPPAAVLSAALLVAMLPRLGWLATTGALSVTAAAQNRPGAALIVLTAGLAPMALLPARGTAWPLGVGAAALGLISAMVGLVGLAGAWPALAARAGTPWRRAALGALGWIWLLLAAELKGAGLYLRVPAAIPPAHVWVGSLDQTVSLVLGPLLHSGVLLGAPVWAAAALVLPGLTRCRSLALRVVLVTVWAAALASATGTAIRLVDPSQVPLASGTAALGAVCAALLALGPSALRTWRVGRVPARFP